MRRFISSRKGNVAIAFALSVPVIGLSAAGGLELARLNVQGARFQEAADASALSGALMLTSQNVTDEYVRNRTRLYAAALIPSKEGKTPTVKVSVERGTQPRVNVEITNDVDLVFSGVLPLKRSKVTRKATAISEATIPVCMLILEPTAPSAWSMQGTPDLVAPDCVIQVNSKSPNALTSGGNARAVTRETRVVAKTSGKSKPDITPAPKFDQASMADPFAASIKWPNPTTCDHTDGQVKKGAKSLSPGVYCGGIGVETHGQLTLQPGVYVVKTGGLTLSSGGSISGLKGVTIVLIDPTATIDVHSKGALELEAPTGGMWNGIAVAVKPQPLKLTSKMQGGGEMKLNGVVYMPSQTLHLTGGGAMDADLSTRMFVVNSLSMQGNGQIKLKGNPSLMAVGGPVRLLK